MADTSLSSPSEALLRTFVMSLLRQNHSINDLTTALQAVKVELALVAQYQTAISDAQQAP